MDIPKVSVKLTNPEDGRSYPHRRDLAFIVDAGENSQVWLLRQFGGLTGTERPPWFRVGLRCFREGLLAVIKGGRE